MFGNSKYSLTIWIAAELQVLAERERILPINEHYCLKYHLSTHWIFNLAVSLCLEILNGLYAIHLGRGYWQNIQHLHITQLFENLVDLFHVHDFLMKYIYAGKLRCIADWFYIRPAFQVITVLLLVNNLKLYNLHCRRFYLLRVNC